MARATTVGIPGNAARWLRAVGLSGLLAAAGHDAGWAADQVPSLRPPGVAAPGAAAEERPAAFIPSPTPPQTAGLRYLLVVESSAAMAPMRDKAAEVISTLILEGFNNRAEPGDLAGLWLIGANVTNSPMPIIAMNVESRAGNSSAALRFLSSLRSKEKAVDLTQLMMHLMSETADGQRRTVYLVTSGTQPIVGTSFDDRINSLFAQHGEQLRKKKTPFVTVLLAEGGRWVAYAVTPGSQAPYVPKFPDKPKSPASAALPAFGPEAVAAAPPARPAPAPLILADTNRTRMLTVDEIVEVLRKSGVGTDTNAPAKGSGP